MIFRIISFNVNGLRSYAKYLNQRNYKFNDYVKKKLKATVLCVQESRGSESNLIEFHTLTDYVAYSSTNKSNSGKYGVCTFICKDFFCHGKTDKLEEFSEFEGDGRFILTKHGNFDILNCYFPFVSETEYRSNDEKDKIKSRKAMKFYYSVGQYLQRHPNTILVGDFNAVYNLQDSYLYFKEATRIKEKQIEIEKNDNIETKLIKENIKSGSNISDDIAKNGRYVNPIVSSTELPYFFKNMKYLNIYFFELPNREWLYKLVNQAKFIDSFRLFSNQNQIYTCWNQILNFRKVNLGTRIDLILVPDKLKYFVINSHVLSDEYGSDHCPVFADFDMKIQMNKKNILNRNNNLLSFFDKK